MCPHHWTIQSYYNKVHVHMQNKGCNNVKFICQIHDLFLTQFNLISDLQQHYQ
eukprot:m.8553 g.8553  ORF g.8553 m.8553 type:complete len:53 (+) comp3920_c0_seq1:657-815(+)